MIKLFSMFLTAALLCLSQSSFSQSNNPEVVSQGGTYLLTIPFADFLGMPGYFQNATFERQISDGSWKLLSVDEALTISSVTAANVIATIDRPIQIFIRIQGFISVCAELGEHAVAKDENSFTIFLYFAKKPPGPIVCVDAVVPFTRIVPLPVYGLSAGEYTYNVNDVMSGSFTLTQENTIP